MSYTVKISENEKAVLKIIQDDMVESPRIDMDNFGTMVCWHRNYNLGDEHSYSEPRDFLESMAFDISDDMDWEDFEEMSDEDLMELIQDKIVILPLYLYDHSGITMNTTGFSCRWDSGQVGWTYATHEQVIKEYGSLDIETATKLLKSEVETYDTYLTGNVYGFTLEEKVDCDSCHNTELKHVDSCWGFYGLDYLEEELKSMFGEEYPELVENLKWAS